MLDFNQKLPIHYSQMQKEILRLGKNLSLMERSQFQTQINPQARIWSHLNPNLNQKQITAYQILNKQNGSKRTYSKENQNLFAKIIELAKGLPFWRPEPDKFIDYNIEKIVKRFDQAQSQEEVDSIINELKKEHNE